MPPTPDTPSQATDTSPRRVRARLWAAGALVGTTVLTAVVAWAVPKIADTAVEGDPVSVTVESDPTRVSAYGSEERAVALPEGPLRAPNPGPTCGDLYAWARAIEGVDAGRTRLHLFTRGEAEGQVVLSGIRAVVDRRAAPTFGQQLFCSPEGELSNRTLTIDLDTAEPKIRYESADGRPFGFTLAAGEVEAFLVTAVTTTSSVWWHLEIDVVSGDERRTLRIDDSGRPFATTAAASEGRWKWESDRWHARGLPSGVAAPPPVVPGERLSTLGAP
jgi:hypothetical protein